MLSMLCLFFDVVPLLSSIGGRSEVSVEPVDRRSMDDELRITYTTIIKTSPFFDHTKSCLAEKVQNEAEFESFISYMHVETSNTLEPLGWI